MLIRQVGGLNSSKMYLIFGHYVSFTVQKGAKTTPFWLNFESDFMAHIPFGLELDRYKDMYEKLSPPTVRLCTQKWVSSILVEQQDHL